MNPLTHFKLNFPTLELKPNELTSKFGHYSYEQRLASLINTLKSREDRELTKFFNYPAYSVNSWIDPTSDDLINLSLNGIYDIKPVTLFLGSIPPENQKQVEEAVEVLEKHPFLKLIKHEHYPSRKYYNVLYVLAPKNNFASESNIKAIDPIVFILCSRVNEHRQTNYYLIPVSQWV